MTDTTLRGCPVAHTDYTTTTPIYEHYALLNADRESERFLYNDSTDRGYFMLQRFPTARELDDARP